MNSASPNIALVHLLITAIRWQIASRQRDSKAATLLTGISANSILTQVFHQEHVCRQMAFPQNGPSECVTTPPQISRFTPKRNFPQNFSATWPVRLAKC